MTLVSELERHTLRSLIALATERDERETAIEREFKSERAAGERRIEETLNTLKSRVDRDLDTAESEYKTTLEETRERLDNKRAETKRRYEGGRFKINEQAEHDQTKTTKAWQDARWTAETVYDAKEPQPGELLEKTMSSLRAKLAGFQAMERQAQDLLKAYHQRRPAARDNAPHESAAHESADADAFKHLDRLNHEASIFLRRVQRAFFARWFVGIRPFVLVLAAVGAAAAWAGTKTQWQFDDQELLLWFGAGGFASAALLLALLYVAARRQVVAAYTDMMQTIDSGRTVRERCLRLASEQRAREEAELRQERDHQLDKAKNKYDPRLAKIKQVRDRLLTQLDDEFARSTSELVRRREQELQEIEDRHATRIRDLNERYERDTSAAQSEFDAAKKQIEDTHIRAWDDLESKWKSGMAQVHDAVNRVKESVDPRFPMWDDPVWTGWRPPSDFAHAIRFGSIEVGLQAIPGGIPRSERLLDVGPMQFTLPAVLDFPTEASILLEAGDQGREEAVGTLQNLMLRFLTAFPPGKVRFTIIDPVGLGQNFAGFMHLADYEEAFVADRIWTESRHIEQRLTDLTEHMENVIQKYLRNDFETITEYNVHAGEIAEPFRFLVIANFPVNFSDTAARRLVSIVDSGPRCGVYTLISMDRRQSMPQGFHPEDLGKSGVVLVHENGRFVCRDEDFAPWPLSLDPPPTPEFLTEKLQIIGESAKDSTRVEVPFGHVTPARDRYWKNSSDTEVRVALGRAGATKLQYLELGRGITQHALIAGKTGSGKSTLLHVLVTNLALHYRPDEVEFYLVDFKKGVEFKTYATHNLPHARAVAIESDREFGLSVLQRLDAELRRRGDVFRRLGVQDLTAYRKLNEPERIPRTLLVIDEFQEFFVEDDKLAQDAALLLDRLVRQGRAFGIHVLLGSQTLGGAYSLARSTIGQMAVRIALQCNDADAMLIMSDDNTAPRLLSRPGEAIYNDQSGLVEGNSPFQIVWLPEHVREKHLREIDELAAAEQYRPPSPQIVFEGNVPADARRNDLLRRVLERAPCEDMPLAPQLWLGDAVAIKDPTAAVFHRQSSTNLLMVGQQDEEALAMQSIGLLALAAQCPIEGPVFYVLDGLPPDAPHAGFFGRIAQRLPHDSRIVGWHDVAGAMEEIGEELDARRSSQRTDAPPVFVFVYALQRFRMLRQEEEFGFSSHAEEEKTRSAARIFGDLLREGPPLGMHTIAWCDTANNLSRAFDRRSMREFDMRVLFQMSANDSSNLIDSPAASVLGQRRALFFSEDHGILEKFRPYALPDDDWITRATQRLREPAVDMS